MAAGLAHELNQPLTSLHLYAEAAAEFAAKGDAAALGDALTQISEQSLRAGEIIRRMRSFIRRSPSNRLPCDVNRLLREVLQLLEGDLRTNGVKVEATLAENLPAVAADGIQIQQVIVNLVRNAVDAMKESDSEHRVLGLLTERRENVVRVCVSDTGGGISPAVVDKLFEPFQTTKPTGLGLGLAICRTLIEAHCGRIGIDRFSSQGTTFYFELPISDEKRDS
jgi:C4-dicarboxylate-specific signal transduction histidine kinase